MRSGYSEQKMRLALFTRNLNLGQAARLCGISEDKFRKKVHSGKWWISEVAAIVKALQMDVAEMLEIFFAEKVN